MVVKLISKDKFNQKIDWTSEKTFSGAISLYIRRIGKNIYGNHYNTYEKQANRLAHCNDTIINGIDRNGQEFLYRTNSCHSRWCPQCSIRKYLNMYKLAKTYLKPLVYGENDYFQHITVDGLNSDTPKEFHHQIKLLKNAYQHIKGLARYRKHCDMCFCVTSPKPRDYKDGSADVLPHLHILTAHRQSWFNGRNYVPVQSNRYDKAKGKTGMNKYDQRKDWAKYLGFTPDISVQNITEPNQHERLNHIVGKFQYIVRPIGTPNTAGALSTKENNIIIQEPNNVKHADHRNYKIIKILHNGMRYVRRFCYSGMIRKIRSRIIHGKHHAKHARPRFIRVYGWLAGWHSHGLIKTFDRLTGTIMPE